MGVVVLAMSALVAMLPAARRVESHAVLVESSPATNGRVEGPDAAIKLRFNVRIDTKRSRLTLVRPDGSTLPLELAKAESAQLLVSEVKGLVPGEYRLQWQVLASDGHLTRGEIPFSVTPH
jgi:methionine-rich copper-binding protein CopC